jgi:hypothetical protein
MTFYLLYILLSIVKAGPTLDKADSLRPPLAIVFGLLISKSSIFEADTTTL